MECRYTRIPKFQGSKGLKKDGEISVEIPSLAETSYKSTKDDLSNEKNLGCKLVV